MTQPSIIELARGGNPDAIALLMNQALTTYAIQVRVKRWESRLVITAIADPVPDRAFVLQFVRQGMANLGATGLQTVVIMGCRAGSLAPVWEEAWHANQWQEVHWGDPPTAATASRTAGAPAPGTRTIAPNAAAAPGPAAASLPLATADGDPFAAADATGLDWVDPHPPAASPRRSPSPPPSAITPNPGGTAGEPRSPITSGRIIACVILVGVTLSITIALKLLLVLMAEAAVYQIPFVGEFLRSIDVIDLLNLLVFAILGLGMGLACSLFGRPWGPRLGALLLIPLVPLIFLLTPAMRYGLWVRNVATTQGISAEAAALTTGTFLRDRVGQDGVWGLYRYSARYPILPITAAAMQEAPSIEKQVNATLSDLSQLDAERVARILALCSWGIRAFYFAISIGATVSHFHRGFRQGLHWFTRAMVYR